jgi:hypothetical protein
MSFHVTATFPDGHACVRVGSNGCGKFLVALLFAGYGLGCWRESRRVRRWVRLYYEPYCGPHYHERITAVPELARLDLALRDYRTKAWLQNLVACSHIDCTWVTLEDNSSSYTASRGLKLKAPKCTVLVGLVVVFRLVCEEGHGEIQVEDVPVVAGAVEEVLPYLQRSCWYDKLEAVSQLLNRAAAHEVPVHFG